MKSIVLLMTLGLGLNAFANTSTSPNLPLDHCYHWLNAGAGYLDFKYDYAKKNNNALTFYTNAGTSNGAIAGPGLYCAKNPSGSHSYGNRVLRIKFVDDVVVLDAMSGKKICGRDGKFYKTDSECQSKDWDVKLYQSNPAWYVIQNPQAIESWTSNSDTLLRDLSADTVQPTMPGYSQKAQATAQLISTERSQKGVLDFINGTGRMRFEDMITNASVLRSLPALMVLLKADKADPNTISEARLDWVLESTVARVLQDPSLNWDDIKPVFKTSSLLKDYFVNGVKKQIQYMNNQRQGLRNLSVMLEITAEAGNQFSQTDISSMVNEGLKEPRNISGLGLSKNLPASTRAIVEDAIARKLTDPAIIKNLANLVALINLTAQDVANSNIRQQVLTAFNKHLQSMKASTLFLYDEKNEYPLGTYAEQAAQLCEAHIASRGLFDKALSIGTKESSVNIGIITKASSVASFCDRQKDILATMLKIQTNSSGAFVITGTFENKLPFKFMATTHSGLISQVEDFWQKNSSFFDDYRIDNVEYSVNGSASVAFNNRQSYWESGSEFAQAFATELENQGLYSDQTRTALSKVSVLTRGKKTPVVVDVNRKKLNFVVNTLEDFKEQCSTMNAILTSKTDTALISINGGPQLKAYTSGYWTTDSELCAGMTNALYGHIPTRLTHSISAKAANSRYVFTATALRTPLQFAINRFEEMKPQCLALVKESGLEKLDRVKIQVPGKSEIQAYTSGYWTSASEICDALTSLATAFIPTQEQLKVLALRTGKTVEISIQKRLNFTLKISNPSQIEDQCESIMSSMKTDRYDRVFFTVNGKSEQQLYTNGYWHDDDVCGVLAKSLPPYLK